MILRLPIQFGSEYKRAMKTRRVYTYKNIISSDYQVSSMCQTLCICNVISFPKLTMLVLFSPCYRRDNVVFKGYLRIPYLKKAIAGLEELNTVSQRSRTFTQHTLCSLAHGKYNCNCSYECQQCTKGPGKREKIK